MWGRGRQPAPPPWPCWRPRLLWGVGAALCPGGGGPHPRPCSLDIGTLPLVGTTRGGPGSARCAREWNCSHLVGGTWEETRGHLGPCLACPGVRWLQAGRAIGLRSCPRSSARRLNSSHYRRGLTAQPAGLSPRWGLDFHRPLSSGEGVGTDCCPGEVEATWEALSPDKQGQSPDSREASPWLGCGVHLPALGTRRCPGLAQLVTEICWTPSSLGACL